MQPEAIRIQPGKDRQLLVCRGTGCESQKANLIYFGLEEALKKAGLFEKVEVKFTGCHGLCQMGPTVMVEPEGTFYCNVTPQDVEEIVEVDVKGGGVVDRLIFIDPKSKKPILSYRDMKFFEPQRRIVLRNCGFIDPESIENYLAVGGYEGIKKAFTMTQAEVIGEMKKSGIRGRGGARVSRRG